MTRKAKQNNSKKPTTLSEGLCSGCGENDSHVVLAFLTSRCPGVVLAAVRYGLVREEGQPVPGSRRESTSCWSAAVPLSQPRNQQGRSKESLVTSFGPWGVSGHQRRGRRSVSGVCDLEGCLHILLQLWVHQDSVSVELLIKQLGYLSFSPS